MKKSADKTAWFTNDRFGMFIHWGLYALPARHEWIRHNEKITTEQYQKYFEHFSPDLHDPRDWARQAKEAGMKYMVITTKHHEGFCLWNTKYTDYKAPLTPCGKDLLTPIVKAFRAEGLKIGFYYSLLDWHHPDFTVDCHHPQRDDKEAIAANSKRKMPRYAQYMRNQVTELLTQFGRIDLMWFDFSYEGKNGLPGKGHLDWESEKLIKLVRKLQPGIMVNNRLNLPGPCDFQTPEQEQPEKQLTDKNGKPVVWEACQTFSGSWGYHRDESTWKTVKQILFMLIDGVSKGGNLLMNVGPTARGEFDNRAKNRLTGVGEWMKRHNRSIYGCKPAPEGLVAPADCRYTYNPETNRLYLHVFSWPFGGIVCKDLAAKIEYAQLLNDGSQIQFKSFDDNRVKLNTPVVGPDVEVPVIEIFLKK